MLRTALLCALYIWDPPTGPVTHYEAELDDEPYETIHLITEPVVEVCVSDDQSHTVRIWAVFEDESRLEITEPGHPRVIQANIPNVPLDICRAADFTGDLRVGFGDFGVFLRLFGTACELPDE